MITTRVVVVALCTLLAAQLSPPVSAQRAPAAMQPIVGTWQLSGLERGSSAQSLARVPNPVGMLIQSGNGYVIEIVSQAARPATLNASEQFTTYQAFWGTTTVEGATASYHVDGHLDPGRMGQRFTRSFERKGTQLVLTDMAAVGGSFTRNFEIKEPQVTLIFPPTTLDGQQVRNTLTLKRLAGVRDMWPDFTR